ncbi:hypothetical protein, partial [Nostoc sp. NMS4]|uniref:hypothetical protein n=1 Tax=Nostoc sp. NMS4 TaxID=2815390 RepID=UPI0025D64E79
VKHTASVHPEPGSNSPFCCVSSLWLRKKIFSEILVTNFDCIFGKSQKQNLLTRIGFFLSFQSIMFFRFGSGWRLSPFHLTRVTSHPLVCQGVNLFFFLNGQIA